MADKKTKAGAPTEPTDYSQIPQESDLAKPTREQIPTGEEAASRGYRLPGHFYALEEAGGDPIKAAQIIADSDTGPKNQDEVNAAADEEQREIMSRMGREYHVPGQKASAGPSENKSGTADEEGTAARKSGRRK